jgi:hypothetical protein
VSARKIRMTAVGLIAMPAERDEALVSADDIPSDPELRTAFGELESLDIDAVEAADAWAEDAATDEGRAARGAVADCVCVELDAALTAALDNNLAALRAALTRARDAATAAGLPTDHENAALAMLPEDAS